MSDRSPLTRRDSLKRIAAAGALVGGGAAGVSSTAADDHDSHGGDGANDGDHDSDGGDRTTGEGDATDDGEINLEPVCVDDAGEARFRVENDADRAVDLTWAAVDPAIAFLDCRRVRFVGDFADCMVHVAWWEEGGIVGTIEEPSGPVEGERIVDPADDLGAPPDAIVTSAEVFEEETPVAPGNGDRSRAHPAYGSCRADALAALEDAGEAGDADPGDGPGHDLTVPAGGSTTFTADAEDGAVTVALFRAGERIAVADGAADRPCDSVVDPDAIGLTAICTDDDGAATYRVRNDNDLEATVEWDVYGADQSGSVTVDANGEQFFEVDTDDEVEATVRLFHDGEEIDVEANNLEPCDVERPCDVDLVPICFRKGEKNEDGSWGTPRGKFRVDNHGEGPADVTWTEDGGDQSGALSVPAGGSEHFWIDLGAECAATVTLHCGGERVDAKAANTVKRCEEE